MTLYASLFCPSPDYLAFLIPPPANLKKSKEEKQSKGV
jgi:hypothetical protein